MKAKAELMARTRKARREAGLVPVTVWVKPEQAAIIRAMDTTASSRKF